MLTLYHAPKSRSVRTLWLLEEIGVPYELKTVSIRRGDGTGERDPSNPHPHGKVPAIVHDGKFVFETPAIVLYLSEAFPAAGLGPEVGDPERAAFLTWLSYYGGVFEPSLTMKFLNLQHVYGTFGWGPFDEVIGYLTAALDKNPFLLESGFSAADIVYAPSIQMLMPRIIPESEAFRAYIARCTERHSFGRALAKGG